MAISTSNAATAPPIGQMAPIWSGLLRSHVYICPSNLLGIAKSVKEICHLFVNLAPPTILLQLIVAESYRISKI